MKNIQVTESWNVVAEIQLTYKSKIKPSDRVRVNSSEDGYQLFLKHWDLDKIDFVEQCKIMLLNCAGHVLGIYEVSTGGTVGTVVDTRLVFAAGLLANARKMLIAHNHPSGNLKPSHEDVQITKRLAEAGRLLQLPVIDHLIVTTDGYYSFADNGQI